MEIIVVGKEELLRLLDDSQFIKESQDNPYGIISIYSSIETPVYYKRTDTVFPVCFDDVTPNDPDVHNYMLFSSRQARHIVRFVRRLHRNGISRLIVQCSAGISRSGAVATALNTYYNKYKENNEKHYKKFYEVNTQIVPNGYVLSLMNKALGMSYISPDIQQKVVVKGEEQGKAAAEAVPVDTRFAKLSGNAWAFANALVCVLRIGYNCVKYVVAPTAEVFDNQEAAAHAAFAWLRTAMSEEDERQPWFTTEGEDK